MDTSEEGEDDNYFSSYLRNLSFEQLQFHSVITLSWMAEESNLIESNVKMDQNGPVIGPRTSSNFWFQQDATEMYSKNKEVTLLCAQGYRDC